MTAKDVEEQLEETPFYVRTYSPGDGMTRYRFFRESQGTNKSSYFGPESGFATCLGGKEAEAFARGLATAYYMESK